MSDNVIATFSIEFERYIDEKSQALKELPCFATSETIVTLYKKMHLVRAMDTKAVNLQRTGQMSTYPSSRGQEAVSVGIGFAMNKDDVLCPYYRDQGASIQRGVGIDEIYRFWGGDERGNHYQHNHQDFPVCVPIATQFLHATGVASAIQYREEKRAVVTTGGEGSTSKGDFYEAINLAGAWNLPLVFVINNNQWAISVPREKQTRSQTIAQKAIAANIPCLQVDGNDVIAVTHAVKQALEQARSGEGPSLIEAVTYRLCDHTTVDDATRYQPEQEVEDAWKKEPIARLAYYLEQQGIWSKDKEQKLGDEIKIIIDDAVEKYLNAKPQAITDLIDHTYRTLPNALLEQRDELEDKSCR